MKIFISWSNDKSNLIAKVLSEYLNLIFDNRISIFYSTEDIHSGYLWFNKIAEELKSTSFGIICLTKINMNNPWLLFEAGALYKGMSSSKVVPLLIDIKNSDIQDPLAQFINCSIEKKSMIRLVRDINKTISEVDGSAINSDNLDKYFNLGWDKFSDSVEKIVNDLEQVEPITFDISMMTPYISEDNLITDTIFYNYETKNKDARIIGYTKREHKQNLKNGFIMLAYVLPDVSNWLPYYLSNYSISFKVKASENINKIMLEVKKEVNGLRSRHFDEILYVNNGIVELSIPLQKYGKIGFLNIKEVCFTIENGFYNADGESELEINELKLVPFINEI